MPNELAVRALVGSKLKAELIAIAEEEDVTYSPQGTKREIAVEIVEARELAEADAADIADEVAGLEVVERPEAELETDEVAGLEPVETPEAELDTDEDPEPVAVAPEMADTSLKDGSPGFEMFKAIATTFILDAVSPEVSEAQESVKAASAAFLAAGAADGPERKARRDAKAKLYALTAEKS